MLLCESLRLHDVTSSQQKTALGNWGAELTWVSAINDEEAWRCDQLHGKAQAPRQATVAYHVACHVITRLLQVEQAHHVSNNAMPLQRFIMFLKFHSTWEF